MATVLAQLPEIGLISNKAISKLVGLAPLADDSGKRRGQRHIRGGREGVRTILYLISWVARKFDASLNDFYQRLIAAGKPKMVARIALAHKILVRLNAKARDARKEMLNAT
jgi:transposase